MKLLHNVAGPLLAAGLALAGPLVARPAAAHPHVFVKVKTQLIVKDGALIGVRHAWLFDETWLGNQLLEHDADGDGRLSPEELVGLTTQSKATLEMFRSFTVVRAGGAMIRATNPRDLAYAYHGALLGLVFTASLAKPVPLAGSEVLLEVYDATWFSSFAFDGAEAVTFDDDGPAGCAINADAPASPQQLNALRMIQRQMGPEFTKPVAPRSAAVSCSSPARLGEATLEAVGLARKGGGGR